jgi:hypothetical protein
MDERILCVLFEGRKCDDHETLMFSCLMYKFVAEFTFLDLSGRTEARVSGFMENSRLNKL